MNPLLALIALFGFVIVMVVLVVALGSVDGRRATRRSELDEAQRRLTALRQASAHARQRVALAREASVDSDTRLLLEDALGRLDAVLIPELAEGRRDD